MKLLRAVVVPLRIVLGLTFALLLVAQTFSFPGMFLHRSRTDDDFTNWHWLVLAAIEVGLLCLQVMVVSTWRLLTLVTRDRVFSRAAARWVDALLGSIGTVWVLVLLAVVVGFAFAEDPGDAVVLMLAFLPATCFALVMVVMRALLLQATALRTDLEGVI